MWFLILLRDSDVEWFKKFIYCITSLPTLHTAGAFDSNLFILDRQFSNRISLWDFNWRFHDLVNMLWNICVIYDHGGYITIIQEHIYWSQNCSSHKTPIFASIVISQNYTYSTILMHNDQYKGVIFVNIWCRVCVSLW